MASISTARVLGASVLLACGAALLVPQLASAHSNTSSATCAGVSGVANNYNPDHVNVMTITIDGTVVFSQQFNTQNFSHAVSVPQDGQPHTWAVDVTSSEPGWSRSVSGSVGPCGEPTTTTLPPTTQPPTTQPPTTQPPTTQPPTTQPPTTQPPTTQPSQTTNPVVTTVPPTDPTVPPTDPTVPPTDPTTPPSPPSTGVSPGGGSSEGGGGVLPATGSDSSVAAVIGAALVLLGGATLFVGRRKPSTLD
jgi:LPXTG-motif cell wall-anchored protein